MPVYAAYIQKEGDYGGAVRPFGNTYHFEVDTEADFDDKFVCDQLQGREREITADWVRFIGARTWGPTDGTQTANVMRESFEYSSTGLLTPVEGAYREVCSLVVWPMPRHPVSNVRRWLRKFLRGGYGSDVETASTMLGVSALSNTARSNLESYALQVAALDDAGTVHRLVGADGTPPNADPIARPYLVTRQIGR